MESDMEKLAVIRKQRAAAHDNYVGLAEKEVLTADETANLDTLETTIKAYDAQIERIEKARALSAGSAQAVDGQDVGGRPFAVAKSDAYEKDRTLVVGGICRMLALGGNTYNAKQASIEVFGERHPVTKALGVSSGPAGGFVVPPDYSSDIIEILRAEAVVRQGKPRNIPMPRGTMTIPAQTSAATATYSGENTAISPSQQKFGQVNAIAKKLTALVPISNDMMRFADPAIDAIVRDDLVKIQALRQDLAFIQGDGTQGTPKGFLGFAGNYALQNGGTLGVYNTGSNSTAATGGKFTTSNATVSQANTNQELKNLKKGLDAASVPNSRRAWFFHANVYDYLYFLLNSYGQFIYRDEMNTGKLMGSPFYVSNQIPVNIQSPSGTSGTTFVYYVEMTEAMVFDAMTLELAVSREGTYIDAGGNTQSAFANDQTLIRAISEHDFQMRHDAAVAVNQFVAWT